MKSTMSPLLIPLGLIVLGGFMYYLFTLSRDQPQSGANNDPILSIDFFAGGSINGNSFKVTIVESSIDFQEFEFGNTNPIKHINRDLSPSEYDMLHRAIVTSTLFDVSSQDFTIEPRIPDQGLYTLTISYKGRQNTLECAIPPPPGAQSSVQECQNQIGKLQDMLNKILGVHIY
jgi:hypothetical protein